MKKKRIALLLAVLLLSVTLAACGGKATGKVTRVYQKLKPGTVHTYLAVKLEDDSTVEVQLPDDNDVWNTAKNKVGKEVTVKKSGSGYEFVQFS